MEGYFNGLYDEGKDLGQSVLLGKTRSRAFDAKNVAFGHIQRYLPANRATANMVRFKVLDSVTRNPGPQPL
jgi:hypothetical protein